MALVDDGEHIALPVQEQLSVEPVPIEDEGLCDQAEGFGVTPHADVQTDEPTTGGQIVW